MSALAFSKNAAAEAADVSPQTISRAIKAGRLKAKRTGMSDDGEPAGKVLILASDLAAWLESLGDA